MARKKLTLKQKRFVKSYVKNGNASEAVKEAYPNIKTENARCVMGSKLVRNGNIQRRIQEVLDETGLNPELIVSELKKLVQDGESSEKNKAIRTASEIMGLIGKGGLIATQVNIDGRAPFQVVAELVEKEERLKELADKHHITNKDFLNELKKEIISY